MAAKRRRARRSSLERLAKQLDERGTVDVLRHGVERPRGRDPARVLQAGARPDPELAAALRGEPAHGHAPARRTTPAATKTLDLALFVNGIPVATGRAEEPAHGPDRRARDRRSTGPTATLRT
ncbi:MAG: hypothetical protein WKF78_13830 [Candidatus Limnocylindrales bacterium]